MGRCCPGRYGALLLVLTLPGISSFLVAVWSKGISPTFPTMKFQVLVPGPSSAGAEAQPGPGWVAWLCHAKCSPGGWNQELGSAEICSCLWGHPCQPHGARGEWLELAAGCLHCCFTQLRAKILSWGLLQCRNKWGSSGINGALIQGSPATARCSNQSRSSVPGALTGE